MPDEYGDEHGVEYADKGDAAAEPVLHDVESAHAGIEPAPRQLIENADNAENRVDGGKYIENFETKGAEKVGAQ